MAEGVVDFDEQDRFLGDVEKLETIAAGGLSVLNTLVLPAVLDKAPQTGKGIFR